MSTLGVFPPSKSRTGFVHTVDGPRHVTGLFRAKDLHPNQKTNPSEFKEFCATLHTTKFNRRRYK